MGHESIGFAWLETNPTESHRTSKAELPMDEPERSATGLRTQMQAVDMRLDTKSESLERILPIDEFQVELTERMIVPVLPAIEAEFLDIRNIVDGELSRRPSKDESLDGPVRENDPYPKGFCLEITVHALKELESRIAKRSSPACAAIDSFRRAGGHFHRVWGILRDRYFQNALQIGSYYFDTANDTVDPAKPKVEYKPMAESGFRNVTSCEDFATILESYWGGWIYPNTHFPTLAPLMPMIWVSDRQVLTVQSPIRYMLRMNIDSGFRTSERFLTQSEWARRSLPVEIGDQIMAFKTAKLPEKSRTPAAGLPAPRLSELCRTYRDNSHHTSQAFLNHLVRWSSRIRIQLEN